MTTSKKMLLLPIACLVGVLAGLKTASASTPNSSYCENDKCMFMAWCQDGGMGTQCNMGTLSGCITQDCDKPN